MFLKLAHTKLDVFHLSKNLTLETYSLTTVFPNEERYALTQQIRRAALSVHLNTAEGCSRRSAAERRRFYEIARGSLIEVDAAIGVAYELNYCNMDQLQKLGETIIKTFKTLTGMLK